MMLSRVADNLYWMSRYLERAEHTARLMDVNLDLMADRSRETVSQAWEKVYLSLQLDVPDNIPEAYEVTQMLTFDASNDASIVSHIAAARENARQVREQLSSEMWEQVNRLYLAVKSTNIQNIWEGQPHQFFQMVKEGAHLFQGIGDTTMNHGEGWHFIQVGQHIERASNVAALLKAYLSEAPGDDQEPGSTNQYVNWVGLLRSCTAFEAYCKVYTADPKYNCIAEFLLLNDEFPHSIHFAVKMMRAALDAIAEATDTRRNSQVYRRVGRLKAMLDYDQIDEVIDDDLQGYLDKVQEQCTQIHSAVYQTYVNYPITEKLIA
jgi:uncharacterized alpha-E superfamily protein